MSVLNFMFELDDAAKEADVNKKIDDKEDLEELKKLNRKEHVGAKFINSNHQASNADETHAKKLNADPLYALKTQEVQRRNKVLLNEYKMKQIKRALKQEETAKQQKKEKKKQKAKDKTLKKLLLQSLKSKKRSDHHDDDEHSSRSRSRSRSRSPRRHNQRRSHRHSNRDRHRKHRRDASRSSSSPSRSRSRSPQRHQRSSDRQSRSDRSRDRHRSRSRSRSPSNHQSMETAPCTKHKKPRKYGLIVHGKYCGVKVDSERKHEQETRLRSIEDRRDTDEPTNRSDRPGNTSRDRTSRRNGHVDEEALLQEMMSTADQYDELRKQRSKQHQARTKREQEKEAMQRGQNKHDEDGDDYLTEMGAKMYMEHGDTLATRLHRNRNTLLKRNQL